MKKVNTKKLNTSERVSAVETFVSAIVPKIEGQLNLNKTEKNALAIVTSMLVKISDGWQSSGTKRKKKPSRDALYLRWYRASKTYDEAVAAGRETEKLAEIRDVAEAEYRKFMEADNLRTGRAYK